MTQKEDDPDEAPKGRPVVRKKRASDTQRRGESLPEPVKSPWPGRLARVLPLVVAMAMCAMAILLSDDPWASFPKTRKDQLLTISTIFVVMSATLGSLLSYLSRATRGLSESRQIGRQHREILRRARQLATSSGGDDPREPSDARPARILLHSNRLFTIGRAKQTTQDRLDRAIAALNARANLNLAIGGTMLLVGVGLLALGTSGQPIERPMDLLLRFLPRATLAVLVEVFAFFFLRMYRDNLQEMRYFQNEQTSQEARFLAASLALRMSDDALQARVIDQMASSDRNAGFASEATPKPRKPIVDKQIVELIGKVIDVAKR